MDHKNKFLEYDHNRAIIYSALEGQYNYDLIKCKEQCSILCTIFDFHFIQGQSSEHHLEIYQGIKEYIINKQKNEFILFAPTEKWEPTLTKVFHKLNGVIDQRSIFELDKEKFLNQFNQHQFRYHVELIDEQTNGSKISFKTAVIKKDDQVISYCKGFMIGDKQVEIDVFTDENFRGNNMAFEVSLCLIKYLLDHQLTPNWSCWSKKESSKRLAQKLGFDFKKNVNAYIWVSDFGMPL